MGRKLSFDIVNWLAHMVWDAKGLFDVILQAYGVYFFRFISGEHLNDIMGRWHWHFVGYPIILRRWHKDISMIPEE